MSEELLPCPRCGALPCDQTGALRERPAVGEDVVERAARRMAVVIAARHGDKPEYWLNDARREEARAALAALAQEPQPSPDAVRVAEREAIAAWLRTNPGVLIDMPSPDDWPFTQQDKTIAAIRQLDADAIERGEHIPQGQGAAEEQG